MRGVPLNERDNEFYYQHVVGISTGDHSISEDSSKKYTLPNGKLIKQAQFFKLSVQGGDGINVLVRAKELSEFTGGTMPDTGLDNDIRALRKVLSEKKM
jgi:hypothetical protein